MSTRYKDMSAVYAAKNIPTPTNLINGCSLLDNLRDWKQTLIVQRTIDEEKEDESLQLPMELETKLFDHQKFGVQWMYNLFCKDSGGILGDDMGLGKTLQVVSLLTGLMLKQRIARVLIIAPVVVLPNWERTLQEHMEKYIPSVETFVLTSDVTKRRRQTIISQSFCTSIRRIIVCSHQILVNMVEDFNQGRWDYIVLDEGHVIKNPDTQISKAMNTLRSRHRILLTGTPIQNKLEEFWSVVNWATNGKAFGSLGNFTKMIADPIARGQNPKAIDYELRIAAEAREILQCITRPILLQRTKKEQVEVQLPEKKEIVLWISLSTEQRSIYKTYTDSSLYHQALTRPTFPVEIINYLRTLCRHPILLNIPKSNKASDESNSCTSAESSEFDAESKSISAAQDEYDVGHIFERIHRVPSIEELMKGSLKLRVLIKMLLRMVNDNHRVLVFSQSKLMLQTIQHILNEFDLDSHKIDGSTPLKERQRIIDAFNNIEDNSEGPRVCLLTTKACGVGITLTGADRVIIFDPSWNPAEDRQAVDRAYRIGQTRPVIVYRMIQSSCLEEKVYEKQVFKEGLRVVSERGIETVKYFAGQDQLKAMLELGPAKETKILEKIPNQISLLQNDGIQDVSGIVGCTRHDELYAETAPSIPNKIHGTFPCLPRATTSSDFQHQRTAVPVRTASDAKERHSMEPLTLKPRSTQIINLVDHEDEDSTSREKGKKGKTAQVQQNSTAIIDLTGDEDDSIIDIEEETMAQNVQLLTTSFSRRCSLLESPLESSVNDVDDHQPPTPDPGTDSTDYWTSDDIYSHQFANLPEGEFYDPYSDMGAYPLGDSGYNDSPDLQRRGPSEVHQYTVELQSPERISGECNDRSSVAGEEMPPTNDHLINESPVHECKHENSQLDESSDSFALPIDNLVSMREICATNAHTQSRQSVGAYINPSLFLCSEANPIDAQEQVANISTPESLRKLPHARTFCSPDNIRIDLSRRQRTHTTVKSRTASTAMKRDAQVLLSSVKIKGASTVRTGPRHANGRQDFFCIAQSPENPENCENASARVYNDCDDISPDFLLDDLLLSNHCKALNFDL